MIADGIQAAQDLEADFLVEVVDGGGIADVALDDPSQSPLFTGKQCDGIVLRGTEDETDDGGGGGAGHQVR
jgi:hypothetical protein